MYDLEVLRVQRDRAVLGFFDIVLLLFFVGTGAINLGVILFIIIFVGVLLARHIADLLDSFLVLCKLSEEGFYLEVHFGLVVLYALHPESGFIHLL